MLFNYLVISVCDIIIMTIFEFYCHTPSFVTYFIVGNYWYCIACIRTIVTVHDGFGFARNNGSITIFEFQCHTTNHVVFFEISGVNTTYGWVLTVWNKCVNSIGACRIFVTSRLDIGSHYTRFTTCG